jgi:hypothetical protein
MAKTKQFIITVQNQPGAVAEIARTLGNSKVNILALLGTTQGTSGTVQLVAEDAKRAKKALDEAKVAYQETTAEEYELPNKPKVTQEPLEVDGGTLHFTPPPVEPILPSGLRQLSASRDPGNP